MPSVPTQVQRLNTLGSSVSTTPGVQRPNNEGQETESHTNEKCYWHNNPLNAAVTPVYLTWICSANALTPATRAAERPAAHFLL